MKWIDALGAASSLQRSREWMAAREPLAGLLLEATVASMVVTGSISFADAVDAKTVRRFALDEK